MMWITWEPYSFKVMWIQNNIKKKLNYYVKDMNTIRGVIKQQQQKYQPLNYVQHQV